MIDMRRLRGSCGFSRISGSRSATPSIRLKWSSRMLLRISEAREHGDDVVASVHGMHDRNAAEALRGARIFVPRSSFPTAGNDEFYWVDLIGLQVFNRDGVRLGDVDPKDYAARRLAYHGDIAHGKAKNRFEE